MAQTFIITIPTLIVLLYVLGGRTWLKSRPWAKGFFAAIEPIEIVLWRKSETILWARFQQLLGGVLTALSYAGTLDLSPLFPLLPEKYKWLPSLLPLIFTVIGKIEEVNRLKTTKPVELVEVPDKAPPQVQAALQVADEIKTEAVAVVKKDAEQKKDTAP